jgi:hypothetical protein
VIEFCIAVGMMTLTMGAMYFALGIGRERK